MIGASRRITWTNTDNTSHTVTSDSGYVDVSNGKFDSTDQLGMLIKPDKTFEFTFTMVGANSYHYKPHPYMRSKVDVVDNCS